MAIRLLHIGVGLCLIAAISLSPASASHRSRFAPRPDARTAPPNVSYGQFSDSPLGHFWYYLGQGRQKKAQEAFKQLRTFEDRYRSLTQAVYPFTYPPGAREVVTNCADMVLKDEGDPHRRAAIYRVLAQISFRLQDIDATIEYAQKAVRLNPNSPWGWFWLAEIYHDRGFYAAEAVARKRELSLFTGNTENDWVYRSHIYHKLGLLYRGSFHQPETAIRYFYGGINEITKLPADENWTAYRAAACGGAFLNILLAMVQDLHDLPRAQQTLEWAAAIIPSFPSEPLDREWLVSLGLCVPTAESPSQ